jgi:hypothetical protein
MYIIIDIEKYILIIILFMKHMFYNRANERDLFICERILASTTTICYSPAFVENREENRMLQIVCA